MTKVGMAEVPTEILSVELISVLRGLLEKALAQATTDEKRRAMPEYLRKAVASEVAALKEYRAQFERVFPLAGSSFGE